MKIELWPSVDYIAEDRLREKIVVVVDVLRATSVITTAIGNGAAQVIVTIETEEAMELKSDNCILGGERKALKVEGFDLSNSPLEYTEEVVRGKTVILSTTNGTKAIKKSEIADRIYIASMLNGRAVAKRLIDENRDTIIICAGTYGKFSLDDFICAGKIIYELNEISKIDMDDFAAASLMTYRDNRWDTLGYVKMANHYKYLVSIGMEEDIRYCFTEDIISMVPEYNDGKITAAE
jgi:2-phosphosulfolactate phosphatase